MARPTDFRPEFITQAKKLARLGATDHQIAEFFEVTPRTLHRWKINHPKFCHALKQGKDEMDGAVEQSLCRRATGYSFDAVKIMQHEGEVIEAPYVEHVPPDTTAMIFWLKNRQPEKWRDRRELTGDGGGPVTVQIVRFGDKNDPPAA